MANPPPRSAQQRKRDTLARLQRDDDAWVAAPDAHGGAYLVPLSFLWDGATLTLATPEASVTGRGLRAAGRARLAIGLTRDVVIIEGTVEAFPAGSVPADLGDAFAARHWDARQESKPYAFLRVTPTRIQAWREVNELPGRTLMRAGRWLV